MAEANPEKPALRRAARAARRAFLQSLAAPDRHAREEALRARLAPLLAAPGPIAGYVAHRGEPDILPFLHRAHAAGHAIALPRIEDGVMRFVAYAPDRPLAPGHAGIAEPPPAATVRPARLLMPLLAFDRQGHRLGQGGGFYDRWLAAHPAPARIGIAWRVQESAGLPVDPWDAALTAIVTEEEWIACP
ncbi:5-formyltetrahydrofolate cyclo-ligase [Sphingomonas morindae]|uniref:5-formyltetrahydrofolate cyclo-ligase n=1 Tax=Sphingomonas morindae TaxID=1541170 RepID=A0ABY4XA51_9SPHN|nr:5-formyltetrahydrofolate cyclo-ligase [Sphingomonas morindae]USI73699.1 5-formyltetrahydrofolate cyclo-ligase [Sphingomonas morindae]